MNVIDFLKNWFSKGEIVSVSDRVEQKQSALAAVEFAMGTAAGMTAAMLSRVRFRTYQKGHEVLDAESYLWNVEPNREQNAPQFWQELTERLFWEGEAVAVEWDGGIYLADAWEKTETGVHTVFRNLCRNGVQLYRELPMGDVLYFQYGGASGRTKLDSMGREYGELLSMAKAKYRRSGGRKVIVEVVSTAAGNKADEAAEQKNLQSRFQNFFEAENAAMKVPRGTKYTDVTGEAGKKTTSELNDVTRLIEDIFARVAQHCQIPAALLMGSTAGTKELMNDWITCGIEPLVLMIQAELNRKRYGLKEYRKSSRIQADTTALLHVELFEVAQAADKLISSGVSNIDELRERVGQAPCGEWWSQIHWMTKNYTPIAQAGRYTGGEEDDRTNFQGGEPG